MVCIKVKEGAELGQTMNLELNSQFIKSTVPIKDIIQGNNISSLLGIILQDTSVFWLLGMGIVSIFSRIDTDGLLLSGEKKLFRNFRFFMWKHYCLYSCLPLCNARLTS